MERDPVCGMSVKPAKAAARVEHAGKSYYFCGQSCAKRFSTQPEKYLQPSVALPSAAPAEKDPVCGMTVDPSRAAATLDYGGKRYLFCHARCAERFRAEPQRFLEVGGVDGGGHTARAMVPRPQEAPVEQRKIRYTCPMHPEVLQWGPGSCPKC